MRYEAFLIGECLAGVAFGAHYDGRFAAVMFVMALVTAAPIVWKLKWKAA